MASRRGRGAASEAGFSGFGGVPRRLGSVLGRLGGVLGPLGCVLGRPEVVLSRLGAILVGLGRVLGRLGRVLGLSWAPREAGTAPGYQPDGGGGAHRGG